MPEVPVRRVVVFAGARKPAFPSGVGNEWRQFAFQQRPIPQSEFDRNIVEAPRTKTPVKMPQAGNDDAEDREAGAWSGLVEDKKIEAGAPGQLDAGQHLIA